MDERTDVLVVGAGHTGCEAALAAARMGLDVTLLTPPVHRLRVPPVALGHAMAPSGYSRSQTSVVRGGAMPSTSRPVP